MDGELHEATAIRSDANQLAMKVARRILDAAHDFDFAFDGAPFSEEAKMVSA